MISQNWGFDHHTTSLFDGGTTDARQKMKFCYNQVNWSHIIQSVYLSIHSKTLMAHLLTVKLNIKPKQTMIFTPLQLSDE